VGSERLKHLRNIAIIIALALIVWLVPGGGTASATVSNILWLVFAGGLLFLGYRIYMERRDAIFGLEDRQRAILYISLAAAVVALVGTGELWSTGGGAVLWMALIGVAAFGLYSVWQAYRSY
jgi:uncharacterized membrane protein